MQSVRVWDGKGREYRIKVTEFKKMFNECNFKPKKAKKHIYLEIERKADGVD